ncbi:hypothetical protein [Herbaspirillum seropedicae]|uniref:hypothetical protein n=1 Tax=Herbaspirillum seropedicae TaxID=964 RepID=UPI0012E9FFAA|nr:hypothetical protein [Herbaspirillum seropedicae]
MSISIQTFLGPETDDLNHRFVHAFADLGFSVELHPESVLTESPPVGALYLKITGTPSRICRLEPDVPLLVAFGYGVSHSRRRRQKQRARLGGKSPCSYVAGSRTSAGRSPAAGAMQMLAMAVLAKETGGYLYADGYEVSVKGDTAVELAMQELAHFEKFNFDAYAHRFESWPPLDKDLPFTWPPEIVPPVTPAQIPVKAKRKLSTLFGYKFSWLHLPGIFFFIYFLVVTILYS